MFPRLCVDLLRKPFSLNLEGWEFLCWFQLSSDVIWLSGNENTTQLYREYFISRYKGPYVPEDPCMEDITYIYHKNQPNVGI